MAIINISGICSLYDVAVEIIPHGLESWCSRLTSFLLDGLFSRRNRFGFLRLDALSGKASLFGSDRRMFKPLMVYEI